jgi:hypothetical protein
MALRTQANAECTTGGFTSWSGTVATLTLEKFTRIRQADLGYDFALVRRRSKLERRRLTAESLSPATTP